MTDSSTNIHSMVMSDQSMENTIHSYGYIPLFNTIKSDYIAAIIILFIGGILYYTIVHSKQFQPIRDYFIRWKTQLLVNTFIRHDNTIQNTSDPNYIRDILSAF